MNKPSILLSAATALSFTLSGCEKSASHETLSKTPKENPSQKLIREYQQQVERIHNTTPDSQISIKIPDGNFCNLNLYLEQNILIIDLSTIKDKKLAQRIALEIKQGTPTPHLLSVGISETILNLENNNTNTLQNIPGVKEDDTHTFMQNYSIVIHNPQ